MTPEILDSRDSLRKEKMPKLAGWYRIALYIILLLVIVILCIYSGVQPDARKIGTTAAWLWNASKVVFYGGLTVVASVAGIHNLRVLKKLRSYDQKVGKFATTVEGAKSILTAQEKYGDPRP